jgi:hypothetical protein
MDGTIVKAGYGELVQKIHRTRKYPYVYIPGGRQKPGERHPVQNVHALVAAAFLGPRPEGMQVRHGDGSKDNNHLSNLCYGTASDNVRDSIAHGTQAMVRKTHCPQGHEYTPENIYVRSRGGRECRTCVIARERTKRANKRSP